jgi:hypothetical protein
VVTLLLLLGVEGVELAVLLVGVALVVVAGVVVVAEPVFEATVVARLRDRAGSLPLISVIAITSHAATNRATAPVTTRWRISRTRCCLFMTDSLRRRRRNTVWTA